MSSAYESRGLDLRERAAIDRLVQRTARACAAGSLHLEPPLARASSAPARADLVVLYDGGGTGDLRERLADLASRAAKALLVVLPNPDRVHLGPDHPQPPDLLRVLWELGRVREHAYLVFPRPVEALGAAQGRVVAPDVANAPVGALMRRTARLHAFVVDTAPRTPQARRRLRMAGDSTASGDPA